MKWADIVLGFFAALAPLAAVVSGVVFYRQTKAKKDLEVVHERTSIEIDEATRNKLIQDASSVNQQREQERETWWASQVTVLRAEIESERRLSNRRFRRLNQLEEWATWHVAWDRKAWTKLLETYPEFEAPPALPEELEHEVTARRERGGNGY